MLWMERNSRVGDGRRILSTSQNVDTAQQARRSAPPITVVKLGGVAAANRNALVALVRELTAETRDRPVLVHGGGAEVSAWTRRLGMEPAFVDGVRMTTPEEMEVVEMVLAGKVNTAIVRTVCASGSRGVGVSLADAGLVTGIPVGAPAENRTAHPGRPDPSLIVDLVAGGYLPVVSSVGSLDDGGPCNINADEAALALAESLHARTLIFLSDIDGVIVDGEVATGFETVSAEHLISTGVIAGGMVPKIRSAFDAVNRGVGRVIIGQYRASGDLARLLAGTHGTHIQSTDSRSEGGLP